MTERTLAVTSLAAFLTLAAGPVLAQPPASVRLLSRTQILSSPDTEASVLSSAEAGTVLEVLERDGDWYGVSLPSDSSGAHPHGWVRAAQAQAAAAVDGTAQTPASQTPARPAPIFIAPTAEEIRAAQARRDAEQRQQQIEQRRQELEEQRVERARQELDRRREEYEAALAGHPPMGAGSGDTQKSAPRPSFESSRTRYEVFGGYSPLWDTSDSVSYPLGWVAAISRPFRGPVSIVGEAAGSYRSVSAPGVAAASARIHTFVAGPQILSTHGSARVFGQLLGGVGITSASLLGYTASSSGLALMPGAGVDLPVVPFGHGLALRLGGELGYVRNQGNWYSLFRLTTGIVVIGSEK